MAEWLQKVHLTDLMESFDEDYPDGLERVRDGVVERLRTVPYAGTIPEFDEIVSQFEPVQDVNEFNAALGLLYDFGDLGHRLWVETF